MRNRPRRRGVNCGPRYGRALTSPRASRQRGLGSGARSRRCRVGRNGTAGEKRAVFPIDDRRRRKDSSGHLARGQIRDPHAGPETAAQTCRCAVIVMVLRMRRSRHVLVLMRARLTGHSRWRYGVRDGRARQKGQRAKQQQKLLCQPPHTAKASAAGGRGQGQLTNRAPKARPDGASFYSLA